jgi:hypothetical protein
MRLLPMRADHVGRGAAEAGGPKLSDVHVDAAMSGNKPLQWRSGLVLPLLDPR